MEVTRSSASVRVVGKRDPERSVAHEMAIVIPDGVCEISTVVSPLFKAYRYLKIEVQVREHGVSSISVVASEMGWRYDSVTKLFVNGFFVASHSAKNTVILLNTEGSALKAGCIRGSVIIRVEVTEQPIAEERKNYAVLLREEKNEKAVSDGDGAGSTVANGAVSASPGETAWDDNDAVGGVCAA